MSIVRQSKFRHVFGKPYKSDKCYTSKSFECEGNGETCLSVSGKFLAMISKPQRVHIVPLEQCGRQESDDLKYIDTSFKVLDIAWSPFNDNLIALSGEDGKVKLYYIPDGGINGAVMTEPWIELVEHMKKVTFIQWNHVADNILATGGFDTFIVIWCLDMGNGEYTAWKKIELEDHPFCLSWNKNGSRFSAVCRSQHIYNVNPRSGEVLKTESPVYSGAKANKCVFLEDGNILSVGQDKAAKKHMYIWKQSGEVIPIDVAMGTGSGQMLMHYDMDLKILYVFVKGEGTIRYYEVKGEDVFELSAYNSSIGQKGGNFIPKRFVSCMENEIVRFYKMTKGKCEPISFIVPRKSEQFQDDLYPECFCGEPALTAVDWINGSDSLPKTKPIQQLSQTTPCTQQQELKAARPKARPFPASGPTQKPVTDDHSHGSAHNGIPEGVDLAEMRDDIKKIKVTIRKMGRRLARLEECIDTEKQGDNEEEEEEE